MRIVDGRFDTSDLQIGRKIDNAWAHVRQKIAEGNYRAAVKRAQAKEGPPAYSEPPDYEALAKKPDSRWIEGVDL